MRQLILSFVMMTAFVVSGAAFAGGRTLSDLPTQWKGVAGDLFQRIPAKLTIHSSYEVSRQEMDGGEFSAVYDVNAELVFPNRTVAVTRIQLASIYKDQDLILVLMTGDQLEPSIYAQVSYDSQTRKFTLTESKAPGVHRFVLEGVK